MALSPELRLVNLVLECKYCRHPTVKKGARFMTAHRFNCERSKRDVPITYSDSAVRQAYAPIEVKTLAAVGARSRKPTTPRPPQRRVGNLGTRDQTRAGHTPLYNLPVVKSAIIPVGKCFHKVQSGLILFAPQNYTRHGSISLLGVNGYGRNEMVEAMAASVSKKSETIAEKSQLSKQDIRLLLIMCTELVNLCAKLTGKIDPAAAAMLAYVRDDIQSENKSELQ